MKLRIILLLALALACAGCWWKEDPAPKPKPDATKPEPVKPLTPDELALKQQHDRAVYNVRIRQCRDAHRSGPDRTKCEDEAAAVLRAAGQEP